ncbi:citrate (pro-3S)-lyase [Halovivax asiaticus JCM 14624]|uniref:Citrate (Pro-3S)-lyase n=1 Tax=Halovivax asiaticus JCM 14624 TaxID=1227490 RepID=M0BS44_9EURY|nr:CoA ester lyase [Halovivax asiaticus]ELZ13831.1 citrate (pro-3S)-lyase [Halovivax asiaticus JCM 14624]
MVRRSIMFTPGDRPEMLRKAPDAGADVIVFDLEDAVAPTRKAEARDAITAVLDDPSFDPDAEVCVRVNSTQTAWQADLEALLGGDADIPDSIMVPKADSSATLRSIAEAIPEYGESLPVLALLESARGILNAAEIAGVETVDALVFGSEDLAADLGATTTPSLSEVTYARQRVVLAAAAHRTDAIDTMVTDFSDKAQLIASAETAVQYGFDGKLAIHPSQVDPINEAFTPDEAQREWARAVLDAKAEAEAAGRGVFEVDGEMIDAPLIAKAERIADQSKAAGVWD